MLQQEFVAEFQAELKGIQADPVQVQTAQFSAELNWLCSMVMILRVDRSQTLRFGLFDGRSFNSILAQSIMIAKSLPFVVFPVNAL